jgi:hypothetical protein
VQKRADLLDIANFGESTVVECREAMKKLGVKHPRWNRRRRKKKPVKKPATTFAAFIPPTAVPTPSGTKPKPKATPSGSKPSRSKGVERPDAKKKKKRPSVRR